MNLVRVEGLGDVERHCLACRKKALASTLWCDLGDENRWAAWYCDQCKDRGYAEKEAKKRARKAKKEGKDDWQRSADDLEEATQT